MGLVNKAIFPGIVLGGYIAKQIITARGRQIEVNSKPGDGTVFWFTRSS